MIWCGGGIIGAGCRKPQVLLCGIHERGRSEAEKESADSDVRWRSDEGSHRLKEKTLCDTSRVSETFRVEESSPHGLLLL